MENVEDKYVYEMKGVSPNMYYEKDGIEIHVTPRPQQFLVFYDGDYLFSRERFHGF